MFQPLTRHIRRVGAALAALSLLAAVGAPAWSGSDPSVVYALPYRVPSARAQAVLELRVLNLINQERAEQGLPPLLPHAGLRHTARAHGQEMFAYGYLSHQSRDGRSLVRRVTDHRIRVRTVAENIAYAADVQTAHTALMDSEGHRRNILWPAFTLVGIAVIDGGPYGLIVVQDFAEAPTIYTVRAAAARNSVPTRR
jgi:uncharacterized protein YkwD